MAQRLDDDLDEGAAPWALGDDDVEPLARWEAEEAVADDWLDAELGRVRRPRDADGGDAPPADAGFTQPGLGEGMVLRRPAPLRTGRRRAAPDAAVDIPPPVVPGYARDRRGTWRYAATGRVVPGARDLTLRSLYRFPIRHGQVFVPVDFVRAEAELAWCLAWKHTLATRLSDGRSVTVLRVPTAEWERRADIPFGLWAPELTATRLLGITDVARLAAVAPTTITAYLSRRRMPPPVMRLGHTPVWSRPVIAEWLARRPGQGKRS